MAREVGDPPAVGFVFVGHGDLDRLQKSAQDVQEHHRDLGRAAHPGRVADGDGVEPAATPGPARDDAVLAPIRRIRSPTSLSCSVGNGPPPTRVVYALMIPSHRSMCRVGTPDPAAIPAALLSSSWSHKDKCRGRRRGSDPCAPSNRSRLPCAEGLDGARPWCRGRRAGVARRSRGNRGRRRSASIGVKSGSIAESRRFLYATIRSEVLDEPLGVVQVADADPVDPADLVAVAGADPPSGRPQVVGELETDSSVSRSSARW